MSLPPVNQFSLREVAISTASNSNAATDTKPTDASDTKATDASDTNPTDDESANHDSDSADDEPVLPSDGPPDLCAWASGALGEASVICTIYPFRFLREGVVAFKASTNRPPSFAHDYGNIDKNKYLTGLWDTQQKKVIDHENLGKGFKRFDLVFIWFDFNFVLKKRKILSIKQLI